jgi:hypothetical protein
LGRNYKAGVLRSDERSRAYAEVFDDVKLMKYVSFGYVKSGKVDNASVLRQVGRIGTELASIAFKKLTLESVDDDSDAS